MACRLASLESADLEGADFTGAILENASVTNAQVRMPAVTVCLLLQLHPNKYLFSGCSPPKIGTLDRVKLSQSGRHNSVNNTSHLCARVAILTNAQVHSSVICAVPCYRIC